MCEILLLQPGTVRIRIGVEDTHQLGATIAAAAAADFELERIARACREAVGIADDAWFVRHTS